MLQNYYNKVICNDNRKIIVKLPNKIFDIIITDPPYGIDYQSNMRTKSEKFKKINDDDNHEARFDIYPELHRVLKDNSVCIVFCSWKNISEEIVELKKYFDVKNAIIWYKGGGGIGDLENTLITDYEIALACHKGNCKIRGKREGSVWHYPKVPPAQMIHPTEKPINLLKKILLTYSDKGDLVFDPFAGSCSTALASIQTGRDCISIELDREWAKKGNERLLSELSRQSTEISMFDSEDFI